MRSITKGDEMKKAKKDARQLKAWNRSKTKAMQRSARSSDLGFYDRHDYHALWFFNRG